MATVQAVLDQGDFILGKALSEFETAFAAACQVEYGIGVACGTDAIALGLQACGIEAGDEVILPANTFVATLIGILRAGAKPILVDCDPTTALIDLAAAEAAITPQTKAIVPVHLYGQMVSPSALRQLAQRHGLIIFEDAAQAHLAEREGDRAGSVGTAAAFSFYPSKNLGALGDGGILVTSTATVAEKARSLRNYGATRKYFHTEAGGTNSRLDTLQAAALQIKLPYLEQWNQARYQAAQYYHQRLQQLEDFGVFPIVNQAGTGHVYHLFVVRLTAVSDRQPLQSALAAQGIQTGIHYPLPCHLQPAFRDLGYSAGEFPQAERLCEEILSLPMYPGLTFAQIDRVVDALQAQLESAKPASRQPLKASP